MAGKSWSTAEPQSACGEKLETLTVQSLTSDKGYYAVSEMQVLQGEGIRTVIADPIDNRRLDKLEPAQKKVVQAARRSVKSKSGKRFYVVAACTSKELRAHFGLRRNETRNLRGWEKPKQSTSWAAAFYNLSQLMRKLFGFGTPSS